MFARIANTFGAKALTAAINLLVAIILSQYLGPSGKGLTSLIITTITFILVFANLVGGATLVYLVPRHPSSRLLIPSYAWTIAAALAGYLVLKAFPLADPSFSIHICILSVMNSLTSIHTTMLIGREKIRQANLIGLVQPFVLVISLFVIFSNASESGIHHYLASLYVSFGAALLVSVIFYRKTFGVTAPGNLKEIWPVFREMLHYGFVNQLAHITQMLSFRLSFYVLEHYHGTAALGVYSNGISLAESVWMIGKSISLVQYARISNIDDRGRSAELTAMLSRVSVAVSLLLLVPMLLLPEGFYVMIFGEGFSETRMVLITLAPGVLVYNYSILAGHYFSGTGRYAVNAAISTIGLAVSLVLYFTLIPSYGSLGAGLATSLSYAATSAMFLFRFGREYRGWHQVFLPTLNDCKILHQELRKRLGQRL